MAEKNTNEIIGDVTPDSENFTSESGVLGARPSGRVLVMALDVPADETMQRLREWLESADHIVALCSFEQWRAAIDGTHPDLVVLEAADHASATQTVRALRLADARVSILVVLMSEEVVATMWPDLQFAGADDFISENIARETLAARVGVLLRLAQLGRETDAGRERFARHLQIDETTQLLNRRFFFQNSHRECSRARRYGHALACLMIDIDYLDEMHKKFGNACVEYVLRAVAYTVRQWTRDSDIAGRFSDRKFVVLLPETDVEGATSVREKILNALSESRFEWEGEELPVNVSFGEAQRKIEMSSPDAHAPAETLADEFDAEPLSVREELAALLEDADAALTVARRASVRPGIFTAYTPGIEESAGQHAMQQTGLQNARQDAQRQI